MSYKEMNMNAIEYLAQNQKRHIEEMMTCLKMQTISANPAKEKDIRECGKWLVEKLAGTGFEHSALKETGGLPAVYADWLHAGKDKPTILVYGHYDVQPVNPVEAWDTPPFEPTIKNGRIFGRGTADDKCQLLIHFFALEALLKTNGQLPVNIKIFLESEEEGGTGSTAKFIKQNSEMLSADVVVLSDSAWITEDTPAIAYGLRGITYFEVKVRGTNRDLHSGRFGGIVRNPLNAMAYIISKLHDDRGRIAIPEIYDDVLSISDAERNEFLKLGNKDEELKKYLEVDALWGEEGFSTYERNWARPALDVNGIWGGYMEKGAKTVIPSEGGFKVSIRLVPNQDPKKIVGLFENYIKEICPAGVTAEVSFLHGERATMTPIDNPFLAKAKEALKKAFNKDVNLIREGLSVPITATFEDILGVKSVLMGFDVPTGNIHAPNENFLLENFYKGTAAAVYFYENSAHI